MRGNTFIPTEHDIFAGLDVDRKSISVTFTSHHGLLRSLRMPYSVEHLVHYVRKHFAGQRVAFAYEAGPTGYGVYDGLVAQAYPCVIAAPAMIPRAPGQRVKTNRLDSRALSENLRGGQLKSSLSKHERRTVLPFDPSTGSGLRTNGIVQRTSESGH